MAYTYVNLTTALADLGRRLYDPTPTFWTDAEKTLLIQEGIRTWNSWANFYRAEFILTLSQGDIWYDITDTNVAPNTLRPLTVTDVDLYNLIEHHFLEPATGATWTGSLQFNADDMIQAVQRRRDEVLSNTGCTIARHVVPANPGRTYLDDKTIDIRRVAWLPVADDVYVNTPLWKDDEFALQAFENDFTTQDPGEPTTYRQSSEPPLSFDTDIPPAIPGEYEVLTVDAGPDLVAGTAQTLMVPDDFSWIIKWGAMAEMLNKSSNATDILRARYCELRYSQGMSLLQNAPAILAARLANLPLDVDSVQNTDDFRVNWQNETASQPDLLVTAGLNLIGMAVSPDAGPYSVTLSVVKNAPIPVNGSDLIQLGRDEYDVLLDYCVHLASFKMGGLEFLSTGPLLERFHRQAAVYNAKLNEVGPFTKTMLELSQLMVEANPVMTEVTEEA